MITEDELANALIRWHRTESVDSDISTEVHYNHYGDRGVVDLYTIDSYHAHLFELKSEHAVKSVTGANQIIKQFNRMQEYFFKDHTVPRSVDEIDFELCFTPCEHNFRHLMENIDMYSTISPPSVNYKLDVSSRIFVRQPDANNITPIQIAGTTRDYRDIFDSEFTFADHVQGVCPNIYTECKSVIDKMSNQ